MSYVKQICDGYNKKTLTGNWYEQRLYPHQPFREEGAKKARNKDEGITCYDDTGFQRALPRLQRRSKWQTYSRVILDDGIGKQKTVMKSQFPHGQQQSCTHLMHRPFDKNADNVQSTSIHPNSQLKIEQKKYLTLNEKNAQELTQERDVLMYRSDFKSTLPTHPQNQKYTNFDSIYKTSYQTGFPQNVKEQTNNRWKQTRQQSGNFNQNATQSVKPITTMICEVKKEQGDQKEVTGIQRSWVPSGDKALAQSLGKTGADYRKAYLPQNDIQTSLNMNKGVHNIHAKIVPDSYFRHIRNITVQPNKTPCNRP